MAAYYNEIDPYAAQWLRNLIAAGHIAPGDVDERSIEDVHPDDLRDYRQCHFFAGVGVWSYALRRAGWPDDRPVWTGSCPCQPFSAAGKGTGFDDERHLWPAWHHLIREFRPTSVFGEQVASKDAGPWIDLVHDDMEALGYAFGAVPFPSAGVGAPHIRDRLYWVADAGRSRLERGDAGALGHERTTADRGGAAGRMADLHDNGRKPRRQGRPALGYRPAAESNRGAGRLADTERKRVRGEGYRPNATAPRGMQGADGEWQRVRSGSRPGGADVAVRMEHPAGDGRQQRRPESSGWSLERRREPNELVIVDADTGTAAGPTNGPWATADWLLCRDGKWRPVEPGTFPLVNGAPSRVGRLRAYGNAINAYQAQIFIEASMT